MIRNNKNSRKQKTRDKLIEELIKEYEIDLETAKKGVDKFIETLKKEGFVDWRTKLNEKNRLWQQKISWTSVGKNSRENCHVYYSGSS